jgi:hypothetical protein
MSVYYQSINLDDDDNNRQFFIFQLYQMHTQIRAIKTEEGKGWPDLCKT